MLRSFACVNYCNHGKTKLFVNIIDTDKLAGTYLISTNSLLIIKSHCMHYKGSQISAQLSVPLPFR